LRPAGTPSREARGREVNEHRRAGAPILSQFWARF
jgi:hypothetical protein